MSKLTGSIYAEWLQHPITQRVFAYYAIKHENAQKIIISGIHSTPKYEIPQHTREMLFITNEIKNLLDPKNIQMTVSTINDLFKQIEKKENE